MSAVFLLLIPLALYFLMIRPQRQRVMAQRSLISTLAPGDRVVTAGGLIGTLVAIDTEQASVEVAPGTVVELLAPAIVRRLDPTVPGSADDAADESAPESARTLAPEED